MNIFTESQKTLLITNACIAREAAQRGLELDPFPIVKLFARHGYMVCLLAALDPHDGNLAYGLYDDGHGHTHEDFLLLNYIAETQLKEGFRIECDPHFVATMPLSLYTATAQGRGMVRT
jgi:hypothetical protein